MRLVQNWPLLALSLALLVGLALGSELPSNAGSLLLALMATVTVLGFGLTLVRATDWFAVPLLLLVVLLAAGSTLVRGLTHPLVGAEVTVSGVVATVISPPVVRAATTRAYVDRADGMRLRAEWPTGELVRYGDQLRITGTVRPPTIDAEFNEVRFLRAHGAAGTLRATAIERLPSRGGNPLLRILHDLRLVLLERLDRSLAPPANTVVAGIVLGEQGSLSPTLEEGFRRTGTTHLLVASGSNLIIFAAIVWTTASALGRRQRVFLTLAILAGFVVLAGAESSIVRASLFSGLGFLAELTGRRVHAPTLISAIAVGMALLNPWIILGDIGFQLSFAAVLGLALFEPVLAARLPGVALKEFLAPTLAAHLATLPILVYHFGQASLIAPLANLIAVPFAVPLMAGGLMTALLPWLRVVAWATEGAATIFLTVVTSLAQLPWASVSLPTSSLTWTGASLSLVLAAFVLRSRWLRLTRLAVARA